MLFVAGEDSCSSVVEGGGEGCLLFVAGEDSCLSVVAGSGEGCLSFEDDPKGDDSHDGLGDKHGVGKCKHRIQ